VAPFTATLKVSNRTPSLKWVTPARSLEQAEKLEREAGYEIYCDDPEISNVELAFEICTEAGLLLLQYSVFATRRQNPKFLTSFGTHFVPRLTSASIDPRLIEAE
jgi:hypothetical protein